MITWKKICLLSILAFVLFDLTLHIGQTFGTYLYRFPTMTSYNLFWTIGWGMVAVVLVVVLTVRRT